MRAQADCSPYNDTMAGDSNSTGDAMVKRNETQRSTLATCVDKGTMKGTAFAISSWSSIIDSPNIQTQFKLRLLYHGEGSL